ncbi:MAG TPA: hypothetical protein VNQ73_07020 [Ilumatobacter sp.]|nr:hypothetical protein [Ilumatobacter sp.]
MSDTPDAAQRAGIDADRQAAADAAFIEAAERETLDRRQSAIAAGRRKGGIAGAAMAGAMIAVSEIVEGPKKDDAPVVVEANSDPTDVDRDGVSVDLAQLSVDAPPLERLDPVTERTGTRRPPVV